MVLLGSGTAAARQAEWGPSLLTGRDWKGFGSKEKEAYIAGFVAGAAAMRIDSAGGETDTTPSQRIDAMRMAKQLPFPYSVSVYASQIDDYYWWENHLEVPIVDVMARTDHQLRAH